MKIRKTKKRKTDVDDIDITSLLDILVILLVFLLKSFNDSELTVQLANELALPYAISQGRAHHGIIVQVNSKKNVFINENLIGNMKSALTLAKLEEELKKEYIKINQKHEKNKDQKRKLINFLFDKSLKYKDINTIVEIANSVDFSLYKFIVQGDE